MRFLATLLLMFAALHTNGSAQEYERVGSFLIPSDNEKVVFLSGDITLQSPLDFRTVLNRRPQARTLVLASNGGSVLGGLLLADDVFSRAINTYVPENMGCYSACAFVFFGGAAREADGELGVHQFGGGEDSAERAQIVVSDILDMLAKFETPQPVISRMLRTLPADMYIFSDDEIASLAINRGEKTLRLLAKLVADLPQPVTDELLASLEVEEDPVASLPASAIDPPQQSQVRFAVYNGVDFYGADVDKIRVTDMGQCLEACFENDQCFAITLNINPAFKTGPNCFLKSGMGETEFYEQAISGLFLQPNDSSVITVDGQSVEPAEIFAGD